MLSLTSMKAEKPASSRHPLRTSSPFFRKHRLIIPFILVFGIFYCANALSTVIEAKPAIQATVSNNFSDVAAIYLQSHYPEYYLHISRQNAGNVKSALPLLMGQGSQFTDPDYKNIIDQK